MPLGGQQQPGGDPELRAGASLTATVTNSNASGRAADDAAGSAQSRTVTIAAGASASPGSVATGGVAFDPLGGGTTTVSVTIRASSRRPRRASDATVSAPGISLLSFPTRRRRAAEQRGGRAAGRVRSTAASRCGLRAAIRRSRKSRRTRRRRGRISSTSRLPNGNTDASFVVEGQDGATGSATITVSAPGLHEPHGQHDDRAAGAIAIESVPANTTTLSTDTPFTVRVGIPLAGNSNLADDSESPRGRVADGDGHQLQRGGRAIDDARRARRSRAPCTIAASASVSPASVATGGVAFDPIGGGTTTVSASIPGLHRHDGRGCGRRHGDPRRRFRCSRCRQPLAAGCRATRQWRDSARRSTAA